MCSPHPGPHTRGRCAPSSDCVWRASAGSRQRQARDARGTRSTFLSWEVSSNSLASLVAELPEDKRSDYKADQGQTAEMQGERRNRALRGRSQADGCPLAAVSDPAERGGGVCERLTLPGRSQQPRQHRPGPPLRAQPVPTSSTGPRLSLQKDGVASWQCGQRPQQLHVSRTRPLAHGLLRTVSWERGPGSARAPP